MAYDISLQALLPSFNLPTQANVLLLVSGVATEDGALIFYGPEPERSMNKDTPLARGKNDTYSKRLGLCVPWSNPFTLDLGSVPGHLGQSSAYCTYHFFLLIT